MAQNIHDGNGDDDGDGDGDLVMIMVMMVVVMISRERAWNFGFFSEEMFPNNTVAQEVIKRCIDYFQNSEHSTLTKSPK